MPNPQIHSSLHIQPKSTFFAPAVKPLANSNIKLPGGKDKPYYYCLGADSTIPFISMQGGGAAQKIVTWGEMIEVLPGQTVTVKNESYMEGDISVNSGHDFAAKPARISLPVNTTEKLIPIPFGGFFVQLTSTFPADTRTCRRGYLKFQIQTATQIVQIQFTGKPQKHSFIGTDLVTGLKTYTQDFEIPAFTQAGSAPMGYGAQNGLGNLEPMAFTDQVGWQLVYPQATPPAFINSLFFYVLEY